MACDRGLAEILRGDLADMPGVADKRMFGGPVFLLDGNMLCGMHPGGGMFRLGKDNEAAALAVPGARPMAFTGRRMGGFIDVSDAALANDDDHGNLMRRALVFVRALPPK